MTLEVSKLEFVDKCIKIAQTLGTFTDDLSMQDVIGTGNLYSDEVITIALSNDGAYFEAYRKLTSDVIILYINGTYTLYKGDFIYLEDHVNKLIDTLI